MNCSKCKQPIKDSEYLDSPSFKGMKFYCDDCCVLVINEESKSKKKKL